MCGLPFAGKSTAAAKLSRRTGARVVGIDDIKTSLGLRDVWERMSPDDWATIFTTAAAQVKEELQAGRSVIYDSTNHTRASRDALRELARDADAKPQVVFLDVPLDTVESRWLANRTRQDRMDLPEWAFRRALEDYEPPWGEDDVLPWEDPAIGL